MEQKTEIAMEGSPAMIARAKREIKGDVRTISETIAYWGARGWEVVTVVEFTSAKDEDDWVRGYHVILKKPR